MGKPTICIGENKDADQLRSNAKLISAFVFATRIVQFLFYLNPKFQASSYFLCLYSLICVGPVRKPHCCFFHEAAQIMLGSLSSLLFLFDYEHTVFILIKLYLNRNVFVQISHITLSFGSVEAACVISETVV